MAMLTSPSTSIRLFKTNEGDELLQLPTNWFFKRTRHRCIQCSCLRESVRLSEEDPEKTISAQAANGRRLGPRESTQSPRRVTLSNKARQLPSKLKEAAEDSDGLLLLRPDVEMWGLFHSVHFTSRKGCGHVPTIVVDRTNTRYGLGPDLTSYRGGA